MQPQQNNPQNPQPPQFFPPYQPGPEAGGPQPPQNAPLPTPTSQPPLPPASAMPMNGGAIPAPVSTPPSRSGSKVLLIALILTVIVMIAAAGFGYWAYSGRQDYKNNTDEKVSVAVEKAVKQESERKDAEFVEKEKQPYKTYTTPGVAGSVKVTFSKVWSGYTKEDTKGTQLVDAYWHPDIVPGPKNDIAYALRLEVVNRSYADEMRGLDNLVKRGSVKVVPYTPKNVSGITGSRVTGEITKGKNTTMVILPLRDKTIKLYTESPDYIKDFDNVVLANLTFTP